MNDCNSNLNNPKYVEQRFCFETKDSEKKRGNREKVKANNREKESKKGIGDRQVSRAVPQRWVKFHFSPFFFVFFFLYFCHDVCVPASECGLCVFVCVYVYMCCVFLSSTACYCCCFIQCE